MNHTPGPWHVGVNTSSIGVYDANGSPIAKLASSYITQGRKDADARLIASSPDLLDAIADLAVYADICAAILKETHPGKAASLTKKVADARSAIAKATGKS